MSNDKPDYTWNERQAVDKWENIDPDDPKNWFRAPPPRPAGLCSKVRLTSEPPLGLDPPPTSDPPSHADPPISC